MTAASRGYAPARRTFTAAAFLRDMAISILVGVAIVYLMSLGESSRLSLSLAVFGAMIGAFVYATNAVLGATCGGWIDRVRTLPGKLVRAILYFVGGCIGWLIASVTANALGLVRVPLSAPALRLYLPVAGGIALLVGLSLYAYSLMGDRLEKSVARLKEAEFAEKELELARSIQQRLLPPQEIDGEGYRIAARNLPARFVAGDFYDVFRLPDGAVGLVVADVAGKGIGASLIMASVKAILPLVAADRSVEETLRELNRRLAPQLSAREFVALAYLRFEPGTGRFVVGNAGLPDPYRLRAGSRPEAIHVPGPRLPLGVRDEVAYETVSGVLEPADRLALVTDGLPEALTAAQEPLGYPRLEELLGRAADPDALFAAVREATGPGLEDDWTAVFLERRCP